MLDLDILLTHYAGIGRVPVRKQTEISKDSIMELCEFYSRRLHIEAGSAGYLVTDEFLFCAKIVQKGTQETILLGPATEHPLSAEAIMRITRELGLSRNHSQQMSNVLKNIPLVSLSDFLKTLSFLNYIINENNVMTSNNAMPTAPKIITPMNAPEPVYHNTAEFEQALIQCIEYGKLDLLHNMLDINVINTKNMGLVSTDSLRALKNVFVTSTTLACRAAVRGGLDYDRALALSDSYLLRLEQIQNYDGFQLLFHEMLTDFTSRTADLHLHNGCSKLIRDVVRDIHGKVYQKITVEQLAATQKVSSSYLSHRFKRETGISLTDYISLQKINEAKRLMQKTDLTLAQIAYQLAFSSQSYFHTVFKKVTGMTPAQFPRQQWD